MEDPRSFQEAIVYFDDIDNCRRFLTELRWIDGKVRCPQCGSDRVTYLDNAKLFKCYAKHPKAKFSLKVGTIFEDSCIGLDKWLCAIWLVVNCKNGISTCEMARDLGITQKSAWFVNYRIRFALYSGSSHKFFGHAEAKHSLANSHTRRRKRGGQAAAWETQLR